MNRTILGTVFAVILGCALLLSGCHKKETPSVPKNLKEAVEQITGPKAPAKEEPQKVVPPKAQPQKVSQKTEVDTDAILKTAKAVTVALLPAQTDDPLAFDLKPAQPATKSQGFVIPASSRRMALKIGDGFGVVGSEECGGSYTLSPGNKQILTVSTSIPGVCLWYRADISFPLVIPAMKTAEAKKNMRVWTVSDVFGLYDSRMVERDSAHGYAYGIMWPQLPEQTFGSPLLDEKGTLLGVNLAARHEKSGMISPVLISVQDIIKAINAIRSKPQPVVAPKPEMPEPGWFGLKLEEITPDIREALGIKEPIRGLLVKQVIQNGPAAKAGVEPGDILTMFNQVPLQGTASQLGDIVDTIAVDQTVDITVLRQGKPMTIAIQAQKKE